MPLKLTLAYDGTRFVGWQRQAEGESIQGTLEAALSRFEGAAVTVHGAGRTDAGVHALGQVASVALTAPHNPATVLRALNAQLPRDVRVVSIEEAPADFHARFGATSKTYRYVIGNSPIENPFERAFAWHVPERLDVLAMRRAARLLVGTHDFRCFQSAGGALGSTTRSITRSEIFVMAARHAGLGWAPAGACDVLAYEVAANGFLRHMVRAIVGTLVDVGRGWRPAECVADLLASGSRASAGATAPAHGLFLVRVDYH